MIKRVMVIAFALLLASPAAGQEMRSFTDDMGRTVQIPVNPQRIASLHSGSVTLPLLELGVVPVGSHGGMRS